MQDLTKVSFSQLPDGEFRLYGYTDQGQYVEKKFHSREANSSQLTNTCLEFASGGRKYRVWFCDLDFSKLIIPFYHLGVVPQSNGFYALYILMAEVSYYVSGCSMGININYLMTQPALTKYKLHLSVLLNNILRTATEFRC